MLLPFFFPLQCDVHFKKYIQPQISGENKGAGSAAKRKGPNGMAVRSKFLAKQKEINGTLADKLCEIVHNVSFKIFMIKTVDRESCCFGF